MKKVSFLLPVLLRACFAGASTISVSATGEADFNTVQAALDAARAAGGTSRVVIVIAPGVYKERLVVPRDSPPITLRGAGESNADVVLTYDLNANSVVPPATEPVGTSGSTSTLIQAADFHAENLTFENSAGDVGQAVALKITGDRGVFRECRFLGWQDTLYVDGGRQYFLNCRIEGHVDYIFGRSTAVFERCEIHNRKGGYITAARTPPESPFGYVFLDCTITGEGQPTFLGRPWQWDRGSNAAVAFIRCRIGPHIVAEGWNPWHRPDRPNEHPERVTRYREFENTDLDGRPLDVSKRVPWSRQLTADEAAAFTVENVLAGEDNWNPKKN